MWGQIYWETGVAGGALVAGAVAGLAAVLMAAGLPGKYSGPFWPHALSKLINKTAVTIDGIAAGRGKLKCDIKIGLPD